MRPCSRGGPSRERSHPIGERAWGGGGGAAVSARKERAAAGLRGNRSGRPRGARDAAGQCWRSPGSGHSHDGKNSLAYPVKKLIQEPDGLISEWDFHP